MFKLKIARFEKKKEINFGIQKLTIRRNKNRIFSTPKIKF